MAIINGNDANNILQGSSAADTLNGLGGDDTLFGNDGADVLNGGAGNDWLAGGAGNDTYKFALGGGNDTIGAGNASDTDTADLGAIALSKLSFAANNPDLTISLTGNDSSISTVTLENWLAAGNGVKKFKIGTITYTNAAAAGGTAGADFIVGTNNAGVTLSGAAGADILVGSSGDDSLDGGLANDGIYGGAGDDTITSGAGSDYVQAGTGDDLIIYKTGDVLTSDTLAGGEGDDTLDASLQISAVTVNLTGTVFTNIENVIGGAGGDIITGGNDADVLDGGLGKDYLRGMGGADTLMGGAGEDTLDGGSGDDTLDGGAGNDIYSFGAGFGNDIIGSSENNQNDTIAFASTLTMNDIAFQQDGANLVIEVRGNDHIELENWFEGGIGAIRKFKAGTTTYSFIQIGNDANNIFTGQNTFADMLFGVAGNDILNGLGGDDKLFGGSGRDTLDGGSGNDLLDGGAGNDVILGGLGADQIIFDSEDQWANVSGGAGNDTLDARNFVREDGYGISINLSEWRFNDTAGRYDESDIEHIIGSGYMDSLFGGSGANLLGGGAGDDVLEGKAGADTLIGGDGADSYVFGASAGGNDVIMKDSSNRHDTLVLTSISDLSNSLRSGNDLVLDFGGSQGKVTLKSWNEGADYAITNVSMDDALYSLYAGTVSADTLTGSDGDDILLGLTGADKMDGGSGSDLLFGGAEADSLAGGDGDDTLWGGAGADTLTGGAGNDVLIGGNDADVYHFDAGFGNDTVKASANNANDIIEFGSSISESSIDMSVIGSDLVINVGGDEGTDTLTLQGWNEATAIAKTTRFRMSGQLYTIQRYLDETKAVSRTITGNDSSELMIGSDGADVIIGNGNSDILSGGDGADTLDGGAGNDRMDGGSGDDILTGGLGMDTYIFGADFGQDTITKAAGNNLDKIKLADGISIEDVGITFGGNDLVLYLGGDSLTGASITVQGWNDGASYKLTSLIAGNQTFVIGNTIQGNDYSDIMNYNDVLTGSAQADMINGLGGNDTINGSGGNDLLIGGAGNDLLIGGAGGDTYRFAGLTFGNDTISGANDNSSDRVVVNFAAVSDGIYGSKLNYFEFARQGSDLIADPTGGDDESSITLANWYVGTNKIKQFVINGQTYSIENVVQGNEANNNLSGTGTLTNIFYGLDGNDTIAGGTGNDLLHGGSGADSLSGAAGTDELYGDMGNDTLLGGDGNDLLVDQNGAESDANLLDGGAGNDTIRAAGYYYDPAHGLGDTLLGGLGDDLLAYAGQLSAAPVPGAEYIKNVLDGGAGNDTITVEQGYYLNVTGGIGNDAIMLTGLETTPLTMNAYYDTIDGGIGRDTLTVSGHAVSLATLYGGNDNDLLIARINTGFHNLLDGGAGNDELRSTTYDASYTYRASDVTLRGGLGNDTYTISSRAFTTVDNSNGGTNNTDFIQFYSGEENEIADYSFSRSGNDLLVQMGDNPEDVVLRVSNWFLGSAYQVQKIVLSDGTLTAEQINNLVFIGNATGGADTITGTEFGDQLAGLGGGDTIDGLAGNDLLDGGSGNDLLIGGEGNDTVIGGLGDDTIVYDGTQGLGTISGNGGTDVLDAMAISQGIKVTSAELQDFEIFLGGSGSDVMNRSGLKGAVTLDGGAGDDTLTGGSAADWIAGGSGGDVLSGGAGADTIYGGEGNDTLSGGSGADLLSGGAGSDTYLIKQGAGYDVIDNIMDFQTDDADTVLFGSGITSDAIDVRQDGSDLIVAISGNDLRWPDFLVLKDWFSETARQISQFTFTAGSIESLSAIEITALAEAQSAILRAASADASLAGTPGNDWLYGGPGDQILTGGAGDDIYVWGDGDGNDRIDSTTDYGTPNGCDTVLIGFNANECWVKYDTTNGLYDLVLGVGVSEASTSQTLCFDNWFNSTGSIGSQQYQVDNLVFADGTTKSAQEIAVLISAPDTYKHF